MVIWASHIRLPQKRRVGEAFEIFEVEFLGVQVIMGSN